ncbi:hypothetical protein FVEG_07950 [Fusarium verticillioides 7600]|uniref:Uncharacterized protein n=1 Tax=Gibberella moniliformis (strain M3125 / FGSC 7600) TaxID=334819 RepID=W7M8T9_GIBM7|nr:hypothetical protein FVEG_07950 [Fusarium verticillioides 7600]EWG48003.1 hypothetical protein FVEG_07950 [Fusarium verticillioides 7600]
MPSSRSDLGTSRKYCNNKIRITEQQAPESWSQPEGSSSAAIPGQYKATPICWSSSQPSIGHQSIFRKAKPQPVSLLVLPFADESFYFKEHLHSTVGRIIEKDA